MQLVGIDVKMHFHFAICQGWCEILEQLTDTIYFVHETHAGTILPLIIVAFSSDFAENTAAVVAVDMYHYHYGVFGPPDSAFAESF